MLSNSHPLPKLEPSLQFPHHLHISRKEKTPPCGSKFINLCYAMKRKTLEWNNVVPSCVDHLAHGHDETHPCWKKAKLTQMGMWWMLNGTGSRSSGVYCQKTKSWTYKTHLARQILTQKMSFLESSASTQVAFFTITYLPLPFIFLTTLCICQKAVLRYILHTI